MTAMESDNVSEELRERLLDHVAYVLTSAHGLYREPQAYGPLRIVDALERTLVMLKELGLSDDRLDGAMAPIRENRWKAGNEPKGFGEAINKSIHQLVKITMAEKAAG